MPLSLAEDFMLSILIASLALPQLAIGSRVPDVELQDMKGKPIRLSQFRGKKVVLFTWASW
jgi:cytochrome oxidase Cu insertion factor (SCO1/SenC/PrrC family)